MQNYGLDCMYVRDKREKKRKQGSLLKMTAMNDDGDDAGLDNSPGRSRFSFGAIRYSVISLFYS